MTEEKEINEQMIAEGRIFAILSYLSVFCLIPILYLSFMKMVPLVSRKVNKFAIFHARQGFVIFLLEAGLFAVNIIPIFGQIVFSLGIVILLIVSGIGVFQVLKGNFWKCPVIGDWAEKFRI